MAPTKLVEILAKVITAHQVATSTTSRRPSPPMKVQKKQPRKGAGRLERLSLHIIRAQQAQSPCLLPVEMEVDEDVEVTPVGIEIDEINTKKYV